MSLVSFAFPLLAVYTAVCYFLTPKDYRWSVLLIASWIFYWTNSKKLLLIQFGTALFTFIIGFLIERLYVVEKEKTERNKEITKEEKKALRNATKRNARIVLFFGITVVLGALILLKYSGFFLKQLSAFSFGEKLKGLNLLVPLGISFYTLQAISYMIDVYRKKYPADHDPFRFLLFMSFFPQILQGPIARHNLLAEQLYEGHDFDYRRACFGAQRMIWGWMKKMIIADRLAIPVAAIFENYAQYKGPIIFFAVALYGLQIYADFSGGMDIAIGFAEVVGVKLEENFRQPYFSTSIEEFWRRWHMTLGGWMRDYVFYPLSLSKPFAWLSRKSRKVLGAKYGKRLPSFIAMFIVYILVGIWHGPEWKYLAFGMYNSVIIVCGLIFGETYDRIRNWLHIDKETVTWKLFQILRTFVIGTFGRYFTRAAGLKDALKMLKLTFTDWTDPTFLTNGSLLKLGLDNANWILLLIAVLVLFYVDHLHEKEVHIRETIAEQNIIFRWLVYYGAIFAIIIFGIYGPAYDAAAFIYGKF
ncbi:MAG: MBOAT family protein [Erysipelotrichaceae bacterium]|nr:MBOAT family protein [Erysipelotrichaceae bacterium]